VGVDGGVLPVRSVNLALVGEMLKWAMTPLVREVS
jgi:hypothetical protein